MKFEKNMPATVSMRAPSQFPRGRALTLGEGSALGSFFFHLLGCLPEEEIRRNRGSQDRHKHPEESARPLQMGHERHRQSVPPIDLGIKRCEYVGEQDERHPFENPCDQLVGSPEQQSND